MITIPEIKNALNELSNELADLRRENTILTQNVAELRLQLGIERESIGCEKTPGPEMPSTAAAVGRGILNRF